MPQVQGEFPIPPNAPWWRRYWSIFKKNLLGRFTTQGDWLVFGLVALASLWLLGRVFGLLRKLLGW